MSSIIEHCCSNECDDLLSALTTRGRKVVERRCLEHCGICRCQPFAVVDGEILLDETTRQQSGNVSLGDDA